MNDDELTPEDIAAFIDGTLSPEERERVLARLLRSPEDFETYAEAVRLARELQAEAETRARQKLLRRRLVLLAAASLAALLALPFVLRIVRGPGSRLDALDGRALATSGATLPGGVATRLSDPGWSDLRSGRDGLTDEQRAFRIGVRMVDLRIALQTGHQSDSIFGELGQLIEHMDGGAVHAARMHALRLLAVRDGEVPTRRVLAVARELERFPGAAWFRLGVWTEQVALAAAASQQAFIVESAERLDALIEDVSTASPAAAGDAIGLLEELRTHLDQNAEPDIPFVRQTTLDVKRTVGG